MKSQSPEPTPVAEIAVPFPGPLAIFAAGLTLFTPLANRTYAAGATTPFTTLEAEAGTLRGSATIRSFVLGSPVPTVATLELEASGGALVELTQIGDAVSWSNPVDGANTIVIRNSIPDAPNGGGITATINLYVYRDFRQRPTLRSHQPS